MAAPAPPVANKFKEATAKLILVLEREWLTRRGVPLPAPTLTAQQKAEIEECFTLMDSDGSGAIDVREIIQAFGSLGFVISKDAIEELMLEADPDGSGELEFDEFLSLMGRALYHPDANGKELVASTTAGSLSFADVVRAFRRKKLIESLMRGGDARRKVVDFHEKVQVLVRAEADELRERAKTHAIFERMETQRAERERLAKVVLPASQRAARVKARLQDVVGRSLGAFEALYAAHNPSASLARLASLAASSRAAASSRGGDSSSRDCSSGEESEDSDDPLGLRRRGMLRSGSQDGADTEGGGVDSARSASPTVPLERAAKSARGGGGGVTFLTEATVEQHKDAQAQPHHGFAAPPLMRSASLNSVDSTTLRTTRRVSAAVLKYFKQLEDSAKKQEQKFDDQARLNAAFVPVAPERSDFKQALYPSRPGSRVAQAVGASALAAAPGASGAGDTLSPGGGPRSPSPTPMGGMRGGGGTGAGTGTGSGGGTGYASASTGGSGNGGICQHPHAWGVRSPSPSLGAGAGSWTGPGSAVVITSASGLPRVPAGAWSGSAGASAGTGGGAGAGTGVRRSFDLSGSRQAMSPSPVPGGSPSLPTSRAWRQTPAFGFGSAAAAPFGWGSGVSPGAALSRGGAAGASTTALNASGFVGGVGGGAVPVPGLPQTLAGLLTPEVAGVVADPRSSWPGPSSTAGTATGIGIGASLAGAPQEPHPQPSSQGVSASGAATGAGASQTSASGSLPALPHQHQHQQPPQPPRAATSLGFAREAQLSTAAAAAELCAPGTSGGRNAVTPEPGASAGAMPTTAGLSQPARAGAGPMPGPITRAWVAQSKSGVNELVTPHTQRESSLKKLGSGAAAGAAPVAAAGGKGGAGAGAGACEGPGSGGGASGGGSGTGSPRQLPAAPGATSPVGVAGLTAGSCTGAGPSTAGSLVTSAPSAAAQLGGSRSRLNLGSSTPTASGAGVAAGNSSGSRSIANGGNSFSHGPFLPVARSPATGASLSGAAAAALVGEIVSVGPAPAVVTGSMSAADHDAAIRSRLRPPRVGSRAATAPAVPTSLAASAPVAFAALPMATVTEAGDEDQLFAALDMDAILADAEVANLSASAGAVPLPGRGGSGGSCGSGVLPVSRKPADGTYPEPVAPAGVRPPPGTAPGSAGLPPPPAHRTAVSSPLPGAAPAAAAAPAGAAAASTAGGGAAAVSQESLRRATASPERRGSSGAIGGTSSRPPSRALLTPASPLSLVPLPPHPHQQHPHPQHGAGPSHDGLLNHRPASPHGAPAPGAALSLPPHGAAPPAPSTPAGYNVPPSPVPALPLRPASPGGSYLPRGAYMNVSNVGHGGGGGAGGGGRRPSARGAQGGGQRWSGRGFGTGTVSGTGTGAANSDAGAAGAGAGAGERPASAARVALTPDALLGGGGSRRRILVTCYGQQVETAVDGAVVVPPAPATRSPESRGGSASGDRYVVNATLVDNSGGAVGQPLQTPTPTPKGARGGRAAAAAAAAGALATTAAHAVPLDLDLDQYMAQQQATQDQDSIAAGDRADSDRQSAGRAAGAALLPVGTAPNATHNRPPPLHLHGHHQRPGSRQQLQPQQHAGQNPQHQPQLPQPYRHAGTPASPQAQPAQPPTRYHQPRLSPQPLAAGGHRRAYTPPSTAAARPDSGASNLAAAHASPAGGIGATGSSAELVVPVPVEGGLPAG